MSMTRFLDANKSRARRAVLIVALMLAPIAVATILGITFLFKSSSASDATVANLPSTTLAAKDIQMSRDAGAGGPAYLFATTITQDDPFIWRDAGAGGPRKLFGVNDTNVWRDAGAGGPRELFGRVTIQGGAR